MSLIRGMYSSGLLAGVMSEQYIKGVLRMIVTRVKSIVIHQSHIPSLHGISLLETDSLRTEAIKSSSLLLNIAALCGAVNAFWG